MIKCQRCRYPVPHLDALLEHWELIHGGIPQTVDVYPMRGCGNQSLGEFRIVRR